MQKIGAIKIIIKNMEGEMLSTPLIDNYCKTIQCLNS